MKMLFSKTVVNNVKSASPWKSAMVLTFASRDSYFPEVEGTEI